jgi:hypothetical protein
MEQTSSLFSASARRRLKQRAVSSIFKRRVFGIPCGENRFSLLPEVIAAIVFTDVSVLVLHAQSLCNSGEPVRPPLRRCGHSLDMRQAWPVRPALTRCRGRWPGRTVAE